MIRISQIDQDLSIYKQNTLVLWGCSVIANKIQLRLKKCGITPQYCCDNNEKLWGTAFRDIKVISPQQLSKLVEQQGADNIVVQFAMQAHHEEMVTLDLKNLGIKKIITSREADLVLENILLMNYLRLLPRKEFLQWKELYLKPGYYESMKVVNENALIKKFIAEDEPVFICLPGKTGDNTLITTFNKNQISNIFTEHKSMGLTKDILLQYQPTLKIITAIRDPLARDLSDIYQQLDMLELYSQYTLFTVESTPFFQDGGDAQRFFDYSLANGRNRRVNRTFCQYEDWTFYQYFFSEFAMNVLDVLNHPFDQKKGYSVMKEGNIEVFAYQLEKLNDIVPALSEFVGTEIEELENSNVASSKWLGTSYQQAKKELKFPKEYVDYLYDDPYVQHFYSQEDIAKFKEKWAKNIK